MCLIHSLIDFGIFLVVDNITKLFITYSRSVEFLFELYHEEKMMNCFILKFRAENRYSILLYECLLLGLISIFMFTYDHIPYILILLVFVQSVGSMLSEIPILDVKRTLRNVLRDCFEVVKFLLDKLWLNVRNRFSKMTYSVKPTRQVMPHQWKYNYPLKPIEDLRSERVSK